MTTPDHIKELMETLTEINTDMDALNVHKELIEDELIEAMEMHGESIMHDGIYVYVGNTIPSPDIVRVK